MPYFLGGGMGWAPLISMIHVGFKPCLIVMLLLCEMIQIWHIILSKMCLNVQFAMQLLVWPNPLGVLVGTTMLNGWEPYVATTAGGIPQFSLWFPVPSGIS